jgi:hypothetical protein
LEVMTEISTQIYKEVVLPTQTASLQNEAAALRKEVEEVHGLRKNVEKLRAELNTTRGKLTEAQLVNVFSLGNPYPVGLGQVRLGDPLDAVLKAYPGARTERIWLYLSVGVTHAAFSSVTYYPHRGVKERPIIQILFHFSAKGDAPNDVLQAKLVEALGQPTSSGPKKDCQNWKVDQKLLVEKDSPNSFMLKSSTVGCVVEPL